jgi:hypothetical protein
MSAEDPAARRARLAALREAAGGEAAVAAPAPSGPPDAAAGAANAPVLKFRNYHADGAALAPGAATVVEAAKAPDLVVEAPARAVVPEGAPDEVRDMELRLPTPPAPQTWPLLPRRRPRVRLGGTPRPTVPVCVRATRPSHAPSHPSPHLLRPSSPRWPPKNRTPTWSATSRPPWPSWNAARSGRSRPCCGSRLGVGVAGSESVGGLCVCV